MLGQRWMRVAAAAAWTLAAGSCTASQSGSHLVTLSLQYDNKVAVDVVVTTGTSVERHQEFLPWTGSSHVPSGTPVTITSVAPQSAGGLLTCTIVEDGHLVTTDSRPAGTAVTCTHKA